MELVKPGTKIDFVGKRKAAAVMSLVLVVTSVVLFFARGPNWGIDFTGGTEIHLRFLQSVEIGEVRGALTRLDLSNDAVQQIGNTEDNEYVLRIQDSTFGADEVEAEVVGALEKSFGADWIAEKTLEAQVGARITVRYNGAAKTIREIQTALESVEATQVQEALDDNTFYVKMPGASGRIEEALRGSLQGRDFEVLQIDSVGPKVGGELRRQGFIAIAMTLVLILVYVGFRFDLAFAPGAVLALFHDVTIVVGIFTITQHEFNLPM
ncbi:MAG: hypothetical protein QGG40_10365, partial [Myxococcota bacterium]|nr:hypothetical protein [Myxococcota bacterium]